MKWTYQPKPMTVEVIAVGIQPFMKWGVFESLRKAKRRPTEPMSDCLRCATAFAPNDDIYLCQWNKGGKPQQNRFVCETCAQECRDIDATAD